MRLWLLGSEEDGRGGEEKRKLNGHLASGLILDGWHVRMRCETPPKRSFESQRKA